MVVISHGSGSVASAAKSAVVGREVSLNGKVHTIVGVMPRGFAMPPRPGDVWKPLVFTPQQIERRGAHYLRVMGRLREGATPEQARAELDALAARLQAQYPNSNAGRSFKIETVVESYTRAPALLTVLLGAAARAAARVRKRRKPARRASSRTRRSPSAWRWARRAGGS